jgi:hypothetical protein
MISSNIKVGFIILGLMTVENRSISFKGTT